MTNIYYKVREHVFGTDVNRPATELDEILLGWKDLNGKTVSSDHLTTNDLKNLVKLFGKEKLLSALKRFRQNFTTMSYDNTMELEERTQYKKDAQNIQKSIEQTKRI